MDKLRHIYCLLIMLALAILAAAIVEAASPRIYRGGKLAGRVISMPFDQYQNWMGQQYTSFHNAPLGNGGKYELLINSPSLSEAHRATRMLVLMRGTAESHINIYKNTTVSALGSPKDCINHNDQSSKVSKTMVTLNPTVISLGNLIHSTQFGSGPNMGGAMRDIHEFTLNPNTLYLISANSDAATNHLSILIDWYEILEGWF